MPSEAGEAPGIPEDRLAEVAIRSGKVAPAQVAEALELAAKMRDLGVERDLLGALVDKKAITSEVADEIRRQAAAPTGPAPAGAGSPSAPAAPSAPSGPTPAEEVGIIFDAEPAGAPAAAAEPEEEPELKMPSRPVPDEIAPCAAHPDQAAIANCRLCAKPVCSKCIVRTERGTFCSRQCLMNWQLSTAAKAEARAAAAVRSLWIGKILILLAIAAALGGAGWFGKHVWDGYRFNSAMGRAERPKASTEQVIADLRTAVGINPESVEANVKLGKALLRAGEAGQAADVLSQALEFEEGNVEALSLLAEAHMAKQDHEEAAAALSRLNEVKGGSFKTNWQLGRLYLERMNEPAKAIEALRLALDAGSECREIRYSLGLALMTSGREDEARAEFERAIAPLSKAEEATSDREARFLANREKVSNVYVTLADLAEKKGDAEGIQKFLAAAQGVAPASLPVVERLVKLHLARGQIQEALLVGERSMKYLSGNAKFILMLCDSLDAAGIYDRRLRLLRTLHRRSAATPGLLEMLVVAEANHGEPEAAKRLLDRVPVSRRTAKEYAPAWEAIVRARLRRGDIGGAEEVLKGLGGLTETDTRFAVLWCRVLHLQGKGTRAIEHAKLATRRSPNEPTPYLVLGTVYRSLGMLREALQSVRKAIDLGGGPEAEIQLGMVLWEGGFPEEAAKHFIAAREVKDLPRHLRLRALSCLARLGGNVTGSRRSGTQPDIESTIAEVAPPAKSQSGLMRQIHLATYSTARYAAVVAGSTQMYGNAEERLRFKAAYEAAVLPRGTDYTELQAELRTAVESFAGAMAAVVPDAKADVDGVRSRYVAAVAERPDLFGHFASASRAQAGMAAAAIRCHPRKADLAATLESILQRMNARRAVAPEPVQIAVGCDYAVAEMLATLVDYGPQGFTYRVATDRALSDAAAADGAVTDAFAQLCVSRAACLKLMRVLCWQAANAARGEE
ncbi:MAG: tetratricopeptide repeat protein [Planctomycetota bacterium]|jgi:tetratricopeptide (TPR) repeat protein